MDNNVTHLVLGASALMGMACAIALLAEPADRAIAEMIAAEQRGTTTICEQVGNRGEWRCQDELPRVVWSAAR